MSTRAQLALRNYGCRIRVSHSESIRSSENTGDLLDDAQQPARVRAAFSLAKED
jgi:hypothetical protein